MSAHVIAAYYAAFNREDHPAMLALLTDDVVHDINQGGSERGRPAFEKFLKHMEHCYRERLEQLVVMVDASGMRAAAEFIVNGTYLRTDPGFPEANGQTYRLPAGAFFELENGRIKRVTTYYNVRAWLSQVEKSRG
jgi:steroid delta-isomerase-like uncharacterized protein